MNNLSKFGKVIKALRMASFWKDGNGSSFLWNYWNPLTLCFIPFWAILIVFLGGIKEIADNGSDYGFFLSKYWKTRRNEREFY